MGPASRRFSKESGMTIESGIKTGIEREAERNRSRNEVPHGEERDKSRREKQQPRSEIGSRAFPRKSAGEFFGEFGLFGKGKGRFGRNSGVVEKGFEFGEAYHPERKSVRQGKTETFGGGFCGKNDDFARAEGFCDGKSGDYLIGRGRKTRKTYDRDDFFRSVIGEKDVFQKGYFVASADVQIRDDIHGFRIRNKLKTERRQGFRLLCGKASATLFLTADSVVNNSRGGCGCYRDEQTDEIVAEVIARPGKTESESRYVDEDIIGDCGHNSAFYVRLYFQLLPEKQETKPQAFFRRKLGKDQLDASAFFRESQRDAGPIGGVRPIKLSNFGERLFSRKRISDSAKLLKFFAPLSRKKVEEPSVGLARK